MYNNETVPPVILRVQRDFGETLNAGFLFIRQNRKALFRALLVIVLPVTLLGGVLMGSAFMDMQPGDNVLTQGALPFFIGYFLILISSVLSITIMYEFMAWYDLHGNVAPTLSETWGRTKKKFFSYFGLFFLQIICFIVIYFLIAAVGAALGVIHWSLAAIAIAVLLSYFFTMFSYGLGCYAFAKQPRVDDIFKPFTLLRGRWWRSFLILTATAILVLCMMYAVAVPVMLITRFGIFSGLESAEGYTHAYSIFALIMAATMALMSLLGLLLQPILYVVLGANVLSLMEEKEAVGLMRHIDAMELSPPVTATTSDAGPY